MTNEQKNKCHMIIHSAAAAAGGGNIVPIPGVDIGADLAAMTGMAIALAAVFGQDLTGAAARGIAYGALKKMVTKQPGKYVAKSAAKYVPFLGTAVSAAISVGLTEAAGWQLAYEFDARYAA